jgi:solute carrier family 25 uncoupling protein 27
MAAPPPEPDPKGRFVEKYLLSVAAAMVAELVTFPLDLTKTRLQLQGEGGVEAPRGMLATARGVVREEGLLALWGGVRPGLARHAVYTGVRMELYDRLRRWAAGRGEVGAGQRAVLGMTAGGLAQLVASPTDLVKVRLQMEGRRRAAGLAPRQTSMLGVLQAVVREGGIVALWRGAVPNVQRAALVNLGDLATYDQAKQRLVAGGWAADSPVTHIVSSLASGLAAATMGTPADVVKARVMTADAGRYRGSLDCLLQTVRAEGPASLYKGFLPCWLRMAPWSLTFWLTFERLRTLAGLQPW